MPAGPLGMGPPAALPRSPGSGSTGSGSTGSGSTGSGAQGLLPDSGVEAGVEAEAGIRGSGSSSSRLAFQADLRRAKHHRQLLIVLAYAVMGMAVALACLVLLMSRDGGSAPSAAVASHASGFALRLGRTIL